MNIVGKNVNRFRTEQNLSLEVLGEKAGWDKKNLHRLEDTGRGYSHESITRLAKALNVSLSSLFDETGTVPSRRVVPIDFYTPDMVLRDSEGKITFRRPQHSSGGESSVLITDGSFPDNAFAFTVNDDAMKPDVSSGDVVIVDPDNQKPAPNDLVLASVYRDGKISVVVRRFAQRAKGFELLTNDDGFASEFAVDNTVTLIGTVAESRIKKKR